MYTPKKTSNAKGYSQTEKKDGQADENIARTNIEFKTGKKDLMTVSEHLENIF
jgi:hypothetical protein